MMQSRSMAPSSILSPDAKTLTIPEAEIRLDKSYESWIRWLSARPDKELLQLTSTSPEHESQTFAQGRNSENQTYASQLGLIVICIYTNHTNLFITCSLL